MLASKRSLSKECSMRGASGSDADYQQGAGALLSRSQLTGTSAYVQTLVACHCCPAVTARTTADLLSRLQSACNPQVVASLTFPNLIFNADCCALQAVCQKWCLPEKWEWHARGIPAVQELQSSVC